MYHCAMFFSLLILHVEYFYIFLVTCIFVMFMWTSVCTMTIGNKDIENTHDPACTDGSDAGLTPIVTVSLLLYITT